MPARLKRTDPALPLKEDFQFHVKLAFTLIAHREMLETVVRSAQLRRIQRMDRMGEAWANRVVPPAR